MWVRRTAARYMARFGSGHTLNYAPVLGICIVHVKEMVYAVLCSGPDRECPWSLGRAWRLRLQPPGRCQ
jgi:hypothetical protein